jgi:hypothetical protein
MKNLKLMMMTLMMSLVFISCKKEQSCNCGTVKNDDIETLNGQMYYTLTIMNECSGNNKKFYVDYNSWLNTPVGQYTCVTNETYWLPENETEIIAVENKEAI